MQGPGRILAGKRCILIAGRPTWAEIDLDAIAHNLKVVRDRCKADVQVLGVVKADAYGHGAVSIAHALARAGVERLGVASIAEALELRQAGITLPIVVLAGNYHRAERLLQQNRLQPVIFRHEVLDALEASIDPGEDPLAVHVKVDTGMGRLGCAPEELPDLVARIQRSPAFQLAGVMSHFARADEVGQQTRQQFESFTECLGPSDWQGAVRHCANSAAIFADSAYHLDMVRPGLCLYGVDPYDEASSGQLQPVLSWWTRINTIRTLPEGSAVGYGGRWVSRRPTRLGILPVGYADGYPWAGEGRAEVVIRNRRVPVVGAISMDMTAVDLTDLDGVEELDPVALLGGPSDRAVRADELCRWSGRLVYELLCSIGPRVTRVYKAGGLAQVGAPDLRVVLP